MDNQTQQNIPPFQSQIQNTVTSSTNWMKILLFILLGLIIVVGLVYAGIIIEKNQINNQQSIIEQPIILPTQEVVSPTTLPTKLIAETLPTSFQDCDKRTLKKGNFNPADYIFPFCDYFIEENSSLYQECISDGGIKTEKICMNCPNCDCNPAGCRLTYIDPSFNLPTNYNECTKIFTHSGGSNGGKKNCSIIFSERGVFNKDIGKQLLKACFSQNGKTFGDDGSCKLKFYE